VAPLLVTSRLLFEQWRLDDGEEDLTVMRVVVDGSRNGRRERHTFDLLDRRDPVAGLSSMARTSGFTCAAIARRVAEGTFSRKGISAPEHLGTDPACYRRVMDDLARRGVRFRIGVEMLPDASPA
jgi:saccharopine dehydrogenase-like NADP-dependent oxidoreductase